MTASSKMSEIMKKLAMMCFRAPMVAPPSSEAAHVALLLAHVAWNRALGHDMQAYQDTLKVFLRANPNLWSELCSRDAETLIEKLRQAKASYYPTDRRVVMVCGMREGNVYVEWCEEYDFPRESELAKKRLDAEFGRR
jgi:hypothetical protein